VTKALGYGVPMVLVPWGRDQPGVAARAAALGAARIAGRMQGQDTVASACARMAEFMDKNAQSERSR
jgi:UDP:flavonoid glycosyltransferase YjiC (YdhE family)